MAYVPRHPSALGLPDVVWRHELGPDVRAADQRDQNNYRSYMKYDLFRFDRIDVADAALKPDYPHIYQAPGWTLVIRKRPPENRLKELGLKCGWWPFDFSRTHSFIHECSPRRQEVLFDDPAGDPWESCNVGEPFYDNVLNPDLRGGYHSASKTIQIDESELRRLGLAKYEFTVKPAFVDLLNYAMKFPPFAGKREVKMRRRRR